MTPRRLLAVALVGVGLVAVVIGIAKLASEGDADSPSSGSSGSLSKVLASARPAGEPFPELTEARLAVGGRCIRVVIADSLDERVEGLRRRDDLGGYGGMLFVFDGATNVGFTMSTVPVALDIGFYDARGTLVSHERMVPCAKVEAQCPVYRADGMFVYALETEDGRLPPGGLSGCVSS